MQGVQSLLSYLLYRIQAFVGESYHEEHRKEVEDMGQACPLSLQAKNLNSLQLQQQGE